MNIFYGIDILILSMKIRTDRQKNQQLITDAMLKYYSVNKVLPDQKTLSKLTGLSTRTIRRYKTDILSTSFSQERRALLLTMMDHIVMALVFAAIKGNITAIRLCFNLVFDWDITKTSFQQRKYT